MRPQCQTFPDYETMKIESMFRVLPLWWWWWLWVWGWRKGVHRQWKAIFRSGKQCPRLSISPQRNVSETHFKQGQTQFMRCGEELKMCVNHVYPGVAPESFGNNNLWSSPAQIKRDVDVDERVFNHLTFSSLLSHHLSSCHPPLLTQMI